MCVGFSSIISIRYWSKWATHAKRIHTHTHTNLHTTRNHHKRNFFQTHKLNRKNQSSIESKCCDSYTAATRKDVQEKQNREGKKRSERDNREEKKKHIIRNRIVVWWATRNRVKPWLNHNKNDYNWNNQNMIWRRRENENRTEWKNWSSKQDIISTNK